MLLGNSSYSSELHFKDSFFFKAFLLSPPSVAGRTHIKQLSEGIEVNFCWLAALSGGSVVFGVASKRLLLDQWEGLFRKSQHCFEKSLCLGGIHPSFTTESVPLRTEERGIAESPPAGQETKCTCVTFLVIDDVKLKYILAILFV